MMSGNLLLGSGVMTVCVIIQCVAVAFQSAVDATIVAPALVRDLFSKLPSGGHQLVIFDLNRNAEIEPLLKADPKAEFATLLDDATRNYTISLITNENSDSKRVIVRHWNPGESKFTENETGLDWPADLYSLSHVCLPFPADDPVYGAHHPDENPGI